MYILGDSTRHLHDTYCDDNRSLLRHCPSNQIFRTQNTEDGCTRQCDHLARYKIRNIWRNTLWFFKSHNLSKNFYLHYDFAKTAINF